MLSTHMFCGTVIILFFFSPLVASKSAYLDGALESIRTHTSGTRDYGCSLTHPRPESVHTDATFRNDATWPQYSLPDSHYWLNMLALFGSQLHFTVNHSQLWICVCVHVYTCTCVHVYCARAHVQYTVVRRYQLYSCEIVILLQTYGNAVYLALSFCWKK